MPLLVLLTQCVFEIGGIYLIGDVKYSEVVRPMRQCTWLSLVLLPRGVTVSGVDAALVVKHVMHSEVDKINHDC